MTTNKFYITTLLISLFLYSKSQFEISGKLEEVTICKGESVQLGVSAIIECDNNIKGSGNITINEGEIYCISEGDVFSGQLTLNGGSLVIIGELNSSNVNIYSGLIYNGGKCNITSFNLNGINSFFKNYGEANLTTVITHGIIENFSILNFNSSIAINGQLINNSKINVNGNLTSYSNIINKGYITVSNSFTLHSGEITLTDGSKLSTTNFSSYGKIIGGNVLCSKVEVTGNSTINNANDFSGLISFCDSDGVETVGIGNLNASVSLDCDCQTVEPTVLNGSTVSYEWFPKEGLDNPYISSPIATPSQSTNYTVIAKDILGNTGTFSSKVNISSLAGDDVSICNGETYQFSADLSCIDISNTTNSYECYDVSTHNDGSNCNIQLVGNGYFSLSNGQNACVPKGTVFTGVVDLNGGTLIINGTFSPTIFNFNSGEVINNKDCNLNYLNINGKFSNYGSLIVGSITYIGWNGEFNNFNSSSFQSLNNSKQITNKGSITINQTFDNNGVFENLCHTTVENNFITNNQFINKGEIIVKNNTSLNSGTITLGSSSILESNNITLSGNVSGSELGQSYVKSNSQTIINSGNMSGNIIFCDENGIETNWGTQGNNVEFTCENKGHSVDINNLVYNWTPSIDLDDPTSNNPTVSPTASRIYTLEVSDQEGNIIASDQVNVKLLPSCTNTTPENAIIITFEPSVIQFQSIDNVSFQEGSLEDFVSSSAVNEVTNAIGYESKNLVTRKVFRNLTSDMTHSISRTGRSIPIPEHFKSTFVVEVPDSQTVDSTILKLKSLNMISVSGAQHALQTLSFHNIPNDTEYAAENQASLTSTSDFANAHINMEEAWKFSTGSGLIKVGIYDTGILYRHEDFDRSSSETGSVVEGGYDWINNEAAIGSYINGEHGTQVGGIVAANRNNNLGVAGVAGGDVTNTGEPGVQLFDMQIADQEGLIPVAKIADIANGIFEGATYNEDGFGYGLNLMNHSWGVPNSSSILYDAFQFAAKNDVVQVTARGNALGYETGIIVTDYPSCYDDQIMISVGASGIDGDFLEANNNGVSATWSSVYGKEMDFLAPGANPLISTTTLGTSGLNNYGDFGGTSASAPHVTGVAALLMNYYNFQNGAEALAMEDIEYILQATATDLREIGYDEKTGWGRINAGDAIKYIEYPANQIKHYSALPTSIRRISENVTLSMTGRINNVSPGLYFGDVYEVKTVIYHDLSSTETIHDRWPLKNWSDGYPYYTLINENPGFTSITNMTSQSTTLVSYVYRIRTNIGGQPVERWVPNNPEGVSQSVSVHVKDESLTSQNELENDVQFTVYPNPTSGNINIKINLKETSDIEISILDISGKVIETVYQKGNQLGNKNLNHDINSIAKGFYFVQLKTGDKTFVKKIIKN